MRRWLVRCAALAAGLPVVVLPVVVPLVAGCGRPPTRAEHTVHAPPPKPHDRPAVVRPKPAPTPAKPLPAPPTPAEVEMARRWVRPLADRDGSTLVGQFTEDATLLLVGAGGHSTSRHGAAEISGWFHGRLFSLPYESVEGVYLGPSARTGMWVAQVQLRDACGRPLLGVLAKLFGDGGLWSRAEVVFTPAERSSAPCEPVEGSGYSGDGRDGEADGR